MNHLSCLGSNMIMQGAITFEEPFIIGYCGIFYKGELYLKIGEDISLKSIVNVCKSLNIAYSNGFSDGFDSSTNKG